MEARKNTFVTTLAMITCGALVLMSCGGGGGGTPPTGMTVSGDVLAPSSLSMTLHLGKIGAVGPLALLDPVPNATVELWEVDDSGNLIGTTPIATTMASLTGAWSFTLPVGLDLSANLVVRTILPTGTMHGQVVTDFISISPLSEFVLQSLASSAGGLGNVTTAEVVTLRGYVEEADLSKTLDTDDINEALSNLADKFVGNAGFDTLVATLAQPSADATALAGDYWYVDISAEVNSFGYTQCWAANAEVRITGEMDGSGTATSLSEAATGVSQVAGPLPPTLNALYAIDWSYGLQWFVDIEDADDFTAGFTRSADGTVTLLSPFEESICDVGSPCEGTGWRWPAFTTTFCPIRLDPANGVFVASVTERSVQYGLTPGGVVDAANPLGAAYHYYMEFLAKKGALTNTALDGTTFGLMHWGQSMEAGPGERLLWGGKSIAIFSADPGATTGSIDHRSDSYGLIRTPAAYPGTTASVMWMDDDGDINHPEYGTDDGILPYMLDETSGLLTISPAAPPDEQGRAYLGNGGDFLMWREWDGMNDSYGENVVSVGVRLATSANPSIDGRTYKVLWQDVCYGQDGATEMSRLLGATVTFTGTPPIPLRVGIVGPTVTLGGTGTFRYKSFDQDTEPDGGDDTISESGDWWWENDGFFGELAFTVDDEGDTINAEGFMNHDGSFGVFFVWSSNLDDIGNSGDACLGMAFLIRQPDPI